MKSFKAYMIKEFYEGMRTYRFLVIIAAFLILAFFDPIMLKLMPSILKSQAPGVDFTQLVNMTQTGAIKNYMKSLFQMMNLIIVLSLMGITVNEILKKELIFPFSKGLSINAMLWAKWAVYSALVTLGAFAGILANYYEFSLLFSKDPVSFKQIIVASSLFSIYYIFTVSLIIFLSTVFMKKLAAGLSALGVIFLMPLLDNIASIQIFLPYNLIKRANQLTSIFDNSAVISVITVFILSVIFIIISAERIRRIEIT